MDKVEGQDRVVPDGEGAQARLAISLLVGLICLFVLAYWPTLIGLHNVWVQFDQSFSHGYLVVGVFLYWLVKFVIKNASEIGPGDLQGLVILPIAAAWIFAESTQTAIIAQLVLPIALWLSFSILFGGNLGRKSAPLFLLLYLAIPIWGILVAPLRHLTASVVQSIVEVIAIPAVIDGYGIELPGGRVEVANGCSGLNYFLVSLVFWAIYSLQNRLNWRGAGICLSIAIAIAILGNWVRVFILVMVGYYSDMQHPLMESHGNFGWIIYAFVLALTLFVFSRLPLKKTDNENANRKWARGKNNKLIYSIALASVSVILAPVVNYMLIGLHADNTYLSLEDKAFSLVTKVDWAPMYDGWDKKQAWEGYISGGLTELQAFVYHRQRQGKELIYYENKIASTENYVSHGVRELGVNIPVVVSVVKNGFRNYLAIWNFKVGERYTVSTVLAKWLMFKSFFSGRDLSALVVMSIRCESDCSKEVEYIDDITFKEEAYSIFSSIKIREE